MIYSGSEFRAGADHNEEVSILFASTLLTTAANNSNLSVTAATFANKNMNTNINTLIQVRSKALRYVTLDKHTSSVTFNNDTAKHQHQRPTINNSYNYGYDYSYSYI